MRRLRILWILLALISTLFTPIHAYDWYEDVDESYWYAPYVHEAAQQGIMTGTSTTTFSPYMQMSRAMAAVVFHRMSGSPKTSYRSIFPDVPSGQYFSEAVTWAYDTGLISGYSSGTFGPSDSLTREQMILMAYRYKARQQGVSWGLVDMGAYTDASSIGSYAKEAMNWALYYNIATDVQGYLHPEQPVTRAESCRILVLTQSMRNGQDPDTIEKIPVSTAKCPHLNTMVLTVSEPSCEHAGVSEVICQDCFEQLEEEIAPGGEHVFEWETVVEATPYSSGFRQYRCIYCGAVEREEIIEPTVQQPESNAGGQYSKPDEDYNISIDQDYSYSGSPSDSIQEEYPGGSSSSTPGQAGYVAVDVGGEYLSVYGYHDSETAMEIFNLVNEYRTRSGLPALQWGSLVEDKAMTRASELTVLVSHMRPNGQHALQYLMEDGTISRASENIAYNSASATAQDIMNGWLSSQDHANNIFSTESTHLAVGVFIEQDGHETNAYFVQCFYSI